MSSLNVRLMATGYSFIDNSQLSIREKIDKYFQTKNVSVVLEESTSSDSSADSFCGLDESFAEILNKNQHVSLIRNPRKIKVAKTNNEQKREQENDYHIKQYREYPNERRNESHDDYENQDELSQERKNDEVPPNNFEISIHRCPYLPTPTRRGEVRRSIKNDDTMEENPLDLWAKVSEESFLEMEKLCESPCNRKNDFINETTLLCDVPEPSFLNYSDSDDSVFEHASASMLSPIKQVAIRRPSTILEESTVRSISSNDVRSGSSLSLKHSVYVDEENNEPTKSHTYRQSILNVFPTKARSGFFDYLESSDKNRKEKENSISLMTFESSDSLDEKSHQKTKTKIEETRKKSISLMHFDELRQASPLNLSVVDQSDFNLSSDGEAPNHFNDTLEAVDYYMRQGKKIMDKTGALSTLLQPCVSMSPKNRNNSLLKQTLAKRHLMNINGDNKLTNKKLF